MGFEHYVEFLYYLARVSRAICAEGQQVILLGSGSSAICLLEVEFRYL